MGGGNSKYDQAKERVADLNELPDKIKQLLEKLNVDETGKIMQPVLKVVNANVEGALQQMTKQRQQERKRIDAEQTQTQRKESVMRQLQTLQAPKP